MRSLYFCSNGLPGSPQFSVGVDNGIKIDRSFIADLHGETKGTAKAILESIIGLGRALAMTVTAEGVESDNQLNDLAEVSCDEVQNYHLGRPQSLEQFADLIDTWPSR